MFLVPTLLMTLALTNNANAGGVQSQAKCIDFDWAANSKRDTPCLVAARILAACNTGSWNIPALQGNDHYTSPNSTTSNVCSCSWATYNLLSACTACQGFESSISNWPAYKLGCDPEDLSDTSFPFDKIPFPPETAIPYWATINPSTWADQKFNVIQAKSAAGEGKPEIDGPPPKKSSPTVGPIVGGVVGGLVAVGLAVGVAFFLKLRQRKQHHQGAVSGAYGPTHIRNKSDISQTSGTDMNLPYMRIQSPQSFATTQMSHPPMSPGPTLHTRAGSVNSLSYFGSMNGSVTHHASPPPPPQRHLSPPPPLHHPAMNREDIIVPFTLQPLTSSQDAISRQPSNTNLADRKRADGAIVPVYDPPSAPPQAVRSDEPPIGSTSRRPKMNPPAYSPYPGQQPDNTSSQPPARSRPPHTKKGSADTQHSWDSNGSGGTAGPGGGGPISAIDDVIGQMGFGANATMSGGDGTVATGQSGNLAGAPRNPAALINPDDITRHNLA